MGMVGEVICDVGDDVMLWSCLREMLIGICSDYQFAYQKNGATPL